MAADLIARLRAGHDDGCNMRDPYATGECDCSFVVRQESADALERAERQLDFCLDQARQGIFVEHGDCPATFACSAIIAELMTDAEKEAGRG